MPEHKFLAPQPGSRVDHVGTYQRVLPVSLARMFENALDWEHLPHLHGHSFSAIELVAADRNGWRATVTLDDGQTMVLDLTVTPSGWVTRTEADGTVTVVAAMYQGMQLPPPNDVVVKSDGAIYFTAPSRERGPNDAVVGVYRVSPDLASVAFIAEGLAIPNGLAFSPDESILYVADSGQRQVVALDLLRSGLRANQTSRVFADMSGPEPGGPDGMKVDRLGNVYVGGAGGLYILDPTGKRLGRIVHGLNFTTNVAFGGDDWKSLYFTTRSTLNVVNIKIPGTPVPSTRASA